ncbi:hypothetical protein KIN20_008416 [Parelaphostrongylus tenuis]|uniref:Uncharacterized protein n=1 Tax=Parelaphostrongylus tenuis TaxID=148309 RepID=A0AAD5QKL8_PARTN|nr:hypothetical protein KIN20_008416 [Parelaphostrongylus tenuis]
MAKVEVQIRSCFCCGLSPATVCIAIYTLILYSLLTGLAAWGLSDTLNNGDLTNYRSCDLEAQGKISAENRKLTFQGGHTTVVVEDSTTYHCSFGLYTEELKYEAGLRYTVLVVNIFIYVCVVLASILMLIGLLIYNQWLLVPWLIIMAIDIIRGLISVFFIFLFSYGNLARIATGIFFLGLQFFHISLLMIVIAKFQRIYNRRKGIMMDQRYDSRAYPGAPSSTYAYSPDNRRDHFSSDHRNPRDYGRDHLPPGPPDHTGYRY